MELRKQGDSHFIKVIRAGSVKRVMNVGSYGRPTLRYKSIEDVYKKENLRNSICFAEMPKREVIHCLPCDTYSMMKDSPGLLTAEVTVKNESETYNFDDDGHAFEGNSAPDYLNFDSMTLKQVQGRCKATKRKRTDKISHLKMADSSFTTKQGSPTQGDEEFDSEEPLSSWKFKLFKRKKFAFEGCSGFPSINLTLGNEVLYNMGYPGHRYALKLEASSREIIEKDCEGIISKQHLALPIVEFRDEDCKYGIEKPLGNWKFKLFIRRKYEVEGCTDYPLPISLSLENDVLYNMGYAAHMHVVEIEASSETIEKDCKGIISQHHLALPIAEFRDEDCIFLTHHHSSAPDAGFQNIDMSKDFLTRPSLKAISWPGSPECPVQALEMAVDDLLECRKPHDFEFSGNCKDIVEDNSPIILEVDSSPLSTGSSFWDPKPHSGLARFLVSDEEHSSSSKNISSSYESRSAAKDHKASHPGINGLAIKEIKHDQKKLQYPPKRLLSARKIISPGSMQRLRKAIDLHQNENNTSKGKLYFSSQNKHRILKAVGLDSNQLTDPNLNPKQCQKEVGRDKIRSKRKSIPKTPAAVAHFCTGRTSIQDCSQNAIAFSQMQMRAIKHLAAKLTKELVSMKTVAKRFVALELSSSKSLMHNFDQVKVAIENANKAEETAEKWLSKITKDGSRFCKLLALIEDSSVASKISAPKERKKLRFADEVGGELCQFFEEDVVSNVDL